MHVEHLFALGAARVAAAVLGTFSPLALLVLERPEHDDQGGVATAALSRFG